MSRKQNNNRESLVGICAENRTITEKVWYMSIKQNNKERINKEFGLIYEQTIEQNKTTCLVSIIITERVLYQ